MFTHAFVPKNFPTNIYHHNCLLSRPVPGCQKPSAGLGERYCWLMITVEYTTPKILGNGESHSGSQPVFHGKTAGGDFVKSGYSLDSSQTHVFPKHGAQRWNILACPDTS